MSDYICMKCGRPAGDEFASEEEAYQWVHWAYCKDCDIWTDYPVPWEIKVENKRDYRGDGEYVGRPTALGNPFIVGHDGTRSEVVEQYREWINDRLEDDGPEMHMFSRLLDKVKKRKELTLICWCAPLKCHADAIKDLLLQVQKEMSG